MAKTAWTMACGTTPEQNSTDSTIVIRPNLLIIFLSMMIHGIFMAIIAHSARVGMKVKTKSESQYRRTSIKINVSESKRQHRTLKLCLFSGLSAWVSTNLSSPPGLPDIFQDTIFSSCIIMIFTPKYRRFPAGFQPIATWRVCNSFGALTVDRLIHGGQPQIRNIRGCRQP